MYSLDVKLDVEYDVLYNGRVGVKYINRRFSPSMES